MNNNLKPYQAWVALIAVLSVFAIQFRSISGLPEEIASARRQLGVLAGEDSPMKTGAQAAVPSPAGRARFEVMTPELVETEPRSV